MLLFGMQLITEVEPKRNLINETVLYLLGPN